jgi:hypothetical protein
MDGNRKKEGCRGAGPFKSAGTATGKDIIEEGEEMKNNLRVGGAES